MNRSVLKNIFVLLLTLAPMFPARAQGEQPVTLEPGKPMERELAGGQSHSYQLALAAGQYLMVIADQKGVDVVVTLFNPEGKELIKVDGPGGPYGSERLSIVIETAGSYRLEVSALKKTAPAGKYEVRIAELRAATAQDRGEAESRRLLNESIRLRNQGKYDEAIKLAEQGLRIREQAFGAEHLVVALALNLLADLCVSNDDYARAVSLHQRSLAIREKQLGPDHRDTAISAHNLALAYRAMGDYAQAEPLFRRALAIFEKNPAPDRSDVALAMDNLAGVYFELGNYAEAEPLLRQALEIREKALGKDHALVAYSINNLAALYGNTERYAKAVELYQRALSLKEKNAGADHPEVAVTLNNLAKTYYDQGDYAQAKQLYQRALAILEKRPGIYEFDLAHSLTGLGAVLQIAGDYARAEDCDLRALALREKILGPEHMMVAQSLGNLSWLYRAKGDAEKAVSYLARGAEITERNISRNLLTGSERRKISYLEMFAHHSDRAISLHVQLAPDNPQAIQLAVTSLLRRKGRALDAMSDTIAQLRRRATTQDQALFDQLATTRSQLATLTFGASGSSDYNSIRLKAKQIEERLEKIESEISGRSAEFKAQSRPITLANVQSAIPAGTALVEFAHYLPFDAPTRKFGAPRYIAYVIAPTGLPRWAGLGEAADIDAAVEKFRRALRSPNRIEVKSVSRKVDEMVMRPVRALIGPSQRVFISPYGSLNLIPFAALLDERGRYLVERYSFNYLTSGRDLLRLQTSGQSRSAPLIVADPAFGKVAAATEQSRSPGLQANAEQDRKPPYTLSRVAFKPLPGTASEAQSLKLILPSARTLTREQATETALKQISGPGILHIATHGFFLKDIEAEMGGTRGLGLSLDTSATIPNLMDNPLLRSGLALAGANEMRGGDDDGILTALEVAGLDLWGTKLVALSACNTGVGELKPSEGVYGLRRALALAGAETQVMSLWPVSDRGARDLMIAYYRALTRGEGRSEALRRVQLRMLRGKGRQHPYYWASFIQSGEWKTLDGKEPASQL